MPISATFDFVPRLPAISHGRGSAAIAPAGYEVAPSDVAEALLKGK